MRLSRLAPGVAAALCCVLLVEAAWAHWCSNIFVARARFVVKPAKTTVNISGGSGTLDRKSVV